MLKSLTEHNTASGTAYVDCGDGETWVGQLASITAPALFITAQHDADSTPEMSRRMANEVQQGQVYIMPGERHMGKYLAAASIEQLIRRFLESPLTAPISNASSER